MSKTIVALYEELAEARQTVHDLVEAGLDNEDISLVVPDPEGRHAAILKEGSAAEGNGPQDAAAEGAVAGTIIGGLAGLLLGLSVFSLPALGPVVIAGPIYTTVMGASAGGIGGGLLGSLVAMGVPKKRARYYSEGIRRGHTLVAVAADEDEVDRIQSMMSAHHPIDIEARAEKWRESGWEGYDEGPDHFEPAEEDEERRHRYPTGAMGSDLYGKEASRDQEPLPTLENEEDEER